MKFSYIILVLFLFGMFASYFLRYTPAGIVFIFTLLSIITYIAYAKDKRAAINGEWRISEGTLNLMSLLCGWPGAVFAQQTLRHKTKKVSFRIVFWATVTINIAAFSWLHIPSGSSQLSKSVYSVESFVYSNVKSEPLKKSLLFLTAYRHRA